VYRIRQDAWSSLLLVPERYAPAIPMPLVVALHGAGASASGPIDFLGPYAESNGFLLMAPESVGGTWDGVNGIYGPDLATIDAALRATFVRCRVDQRRIALQGFSDGASYALGVGITNPEIFTHVMAMSPGFITGSRQQPVKPRVFISHGRDDRILPIDTASRVIVPELRMAGYEVTYVEFDGMHTVPPDIASTAVQFMLTS
jgi:predicted esterase